MHSTFVLISDNLQSQWNASNIKEEVKDDVDSKDTPELLQANAQLIEQLKNVQNERLSSTPPPHFSHVIKPSDKEYENIPKCHETESYEQTQSATEVRNQG